MNTRVLRDPGGSGGGGIQDFLSGGGNPPVLPTNPTVPPTPPPAPPTPPVLPPTPPPPVPPTPVPPVEGVNPDGTLQEGYIKDPATGNITKVPEPPGEPNPMAFLEEVEKITGMKFDITYPDGVDPDVPEGVAIRELAIYERGQSDLDAFLLRRDPRAYAYMVHRAEGGDDESFMSGGKGFVLPTKEEFDKSADLQAAVYRHELSNKGLEKETIDLLVDNATKKNLLKAEGDKAYTAIQTRDTKLLAEAQARTDRANTESTNAIVAIKKNITKAVRESLKFAIPEQNQPEFETFVHNNLQYDPEDRVFRVTTEITPDNFTNILNSLFFLYKNADLKQLVEKQSKTQAAQNLKRKLGGAAGGPGEGGGGDNTTKKALTLTEFLGG